jgi:hypothetical protein
VKIPNVPPWTRNCASQDSNSPADKTIGAPRTWANQVEVAFPGGIDRKHVIGVCPVDKATKVEIMSAARATRMTRPGTEVRRPPGWSPRCRYGRAVNLTCGSKPARHDKRKKRGGPVAHIDIEEARKQFERIDADGDGSITAAEFKTALAQGGDWNVTESVAEAIIKSRDLNGDKVLSFDEFWSFLNK